MNFSISHISIVPVRFGPSHKSEQLTQLLFGEIVEILDTKGKSWIKVRCLWDNQIGWVISQQIHSITDSEYALFSKNHAFALELFHPLMSSHHHLPVTLGAKLPNFDGMRLKFAERTYMYSGQAVFPSDIQPIPELVIKLARRFLFAPFQWGGRSPLGIDASGLVQLVFQLVGVQLQREAAQQVLQGETVDFIEQSAPGDIAYFENNRGNVHHAGIILPENQIIHAGECVRIDKIDHYGIYNEQQKKYTHRLRLVKRVLPYAPSHIIKKKEPLTAAIKQVELF